jgi:hypothetical protein
MQELIRLFTKRSPVILNKENISSFGIHSHPDKYQSTRFRNWLALCRVNDVEKLQAEMLKFLQSKDSIKTIEELGKELNNLITSFFIKGNQLTKEKSYEIIKASKVEALCSKEKGAFADKYMAVADTIICLAYLKNLSNKENIDYQAILKVMTYTERCIESKFQIPELDILKYFLKPVLLPSCFAKTNACDDTKPTDTRFSFLNDQRQSKENIKGCISSNCTCQENEDCVKQSKCCAKPRIDLIDLMVVKTYTKCYQAGDISYIKNVLEGEILSTKHKELNRTEELTESETDIKQFEEKHLQTEDKTSLHNETEDVLKTDKGMDAGLTTNSTFGANIKAINFGFGTNSSTNLHINQTKTITNKIVQDYSKDVINRATRQLEQKVRNLSKVTKIHETLEKNKHVFDNSKGDNNINGQYLFVNKISRAQVYNYGIHPVIDLILPEPAALYKKLFEKKFEGVKPNKPAEFKIKATDTNELTLNDINEKNYEDLAKRYNLKDIQPPPENYKIKSLFFRKDNAQEDYKMPPKVGVWQSLGNGTDNGPRDFNIDAGYYTESMEANLNGDTVFLSLHNSDCFISFSLAGYSLLYGSGSIINRNPVDLPQLEGTQTISVFYNEVKNYDVTVFVKCKRKEELYTSWQNNIYSLLKVEYDKEIAIYQKAYSEYMIAKEEFDTRVEKEKKERYNKNSFILRELEKTELKRMAISYISCQFFDQFDAMKNKVEPCGYPEMNIKEAEKEGQIIQFFEQSINWNLMTYIFYPYFWGKKCSWGKNLKEETTDLIFEKFLQAGSCHIQIPVRPSHYSLMQHFLDFGEIWNGAGEPPLPNDPYYVSLAQEIKEQFQNFNTERLGRIDVTNGNPVVILNGTDEYWDFTNSIINQPNIDADIDREILFDDYKTYRIVSIEPNPAVTTHDSWLITLDRPFEGITNTKLMWSTGAIYIGTPWEFVTPTNLIFLRDKSKCLPCYPLKECKEL